MRLARWSLALAGLGYLGFGASLLIWPGLLARVAVAATAPAGVVELRAFYGGLELGLGAFLLLALGRPAWYRPALLAQTLSLGGIAIARLAGLAASPTGDGVILASLAAEAAGAALGALALARLPTRTPEPERAP